MVKNKYIKKICKNCGYWKINKKRGHSEYVNGEYYESSEWDMDQNQWEFPFDVKYCNRVKENSFLGKDNEFGVHDGSIYLAAFYTAENFGCIHFVNNSEVLENQNG